MNSLHLVVALAPLALYLLYLAVLNLRGRPVLVSGGRDTAALGIGVAGLMILGPIELLVPEEAAIRFGAFVWLLMGILYALSLSLIVLLQRPRLTIYNILPEVCRAVISDAVSTLDTEARWAGDSLCLAQLGVALHMDFEPGRRNVELVAADDRQNRAGWKRLEAAVRERLTRVETAPSIWGAVLALASLVVATGVAWQLANDPQAFVQSVRDLFGS